MTPIQQIACGAIAVQCKIPGRDPQMAAMVWLLGQITGVTNCATIKAGADSLACLDRQELLAAVVWQLMQIQAQGGGMGPPGPIGQQGPPGYAPVTSGAYGGNPPPFTPVLLAGQMAIAFDTNTGRPWWWPFGAAAWQ